MPQNITLEEFDIENEDDLLQNIDSFDQAVIWGTDWTTETINNQLNRKNIDLFPKFQRRDAWSITAKSKFIESLILGLPIPQIILAEKKDEKGKYIVIDGKQRLLTIKQFFSKENDDFTPIKLKGLDILQSLNRKDYSDIENDAELNQILNQLQNQTIRTTVIKNWPNEDFLFTVFLRLNTGSIKLSPQELRQALHPGLFIDFTDDFSINSQPIKRVLGITRPDYRMRDVELVIRYFSFKYFITNYEGNLKKAFDSTVKILNENWHNREDEIIEDAENLNTAINLTFDIFGEKEAFSKWANQKFQNNFNRAIFDIMVYYFSNNEIYEIAMTKKEEIKNAFIALCENNRAFVSSFEHTTKSLQNTNIRLTIWGKKLSEILELTIDIPTLNNENRFELINYTHG
ncbi:Protein of unknown function DUF262 [Chryseobacterium arachidis]|uniref:GmrSD restriction endonucleases N-terminal domain-containing protein n=1 Tax=Chryseobacterium arachidis TaxID=1416778 RepID=A0A1M5JN64_9FLAO|nr:DUF262 domain-containing protein [Chryseobacterium arachidis]SHG42032.1 Protein of unknown function DUF262 [Chryseobacterium arachidis]